jgi:hypothetical protein
VNDDVAGMLQMMTNVLNMGSCNVGYIQLPVVQSQTTLMAMTKRRRLIEDQLFNANIDFSNLMTLVFQKESMRATTDKRPVSQQCLVCVSSKGNKWLESSAVKAAVLGPCPVCSVSDMIGYDPDVKPGAAARAEQSLE